MFLNQKTTGDLSSVAWGSKERPSTNEVHDMSNIPAAIKLEFPDLIQKHSGSGFIRPRFTGDATLYDYGYFWENLDGDRFYFETYEAAAHDVAQDMDFTEHEASEILFRNH